VQREVLDLSSSRADIPRVSRVHSGLEGSPTVLKRPCFQTTQHSWRAATVEATHDPLTIRSGRVEPQPPPALHRPLAALLHPARLRHSDSVRHCSAGCGLLLHRLRLRARARARAHAPVVPPAPPPAAARVLPPPFAPAAAAPPAALPRLLRAPLALLAPAPPAAWLRLAVGGCAGCAVACACLHGGSTSYSLHSQRRVRQHAATASTQPRNGATRAQVAQQADHFGNASHTTRAPGHARPTVGASAEPRRSAASWR
jgi:hypothetical protein